MPDQRHQAVLRVCAIARATTEALLRDTVGQDAGELFAGLQELSFVATGPDGVRPHDLARDVLDADLRWRDPDEYTRILRRVTAHIHARLRSLDGREQLRAISDLQFLFRKVPSVLTPVDWASGASTMPSPPGPATARRRCA